MAINKIVKLCLETRAKELRGAGKSLDEIATTLSSESKQKITKASLFRYFEANKMAAVQAIETHDKLQVKVVEAEISTIEQRQKVIQGLIDLAKDKSIEGKTRVHAYRAANEALDSLDSRLGKLSPRGQGPTFNLNNFNLNNVKELPDAELIRIIEQEE